VNRRQNLPGCAWRCDCCSCNSGDLQCARRARPRLQCAARWPCSRLQCAARRPHTRARLPRARRPRPRLQCAARRPHTRARLPRAISLSATCSLFRLFQSFSNLTG
jgi:hypothetical protein